VRISLCWITDDAECGFVGNDLNAFDIVNRAVEDEFGVENQFLDSLQGSCGLVFIES